jgi:aryl-alcohol dehydrogenase-like predicted oxidoreductase
MHYTELSNTGIKISRLCFGTMNIGQQNSEADGHEQMDYAVARGINFIDTAEMYPIPPSKEKQGLTETFIGTWLKKRGKRDDLVIASKVSSRNQNSFMSSRDASQGLNRKNILEAIDGTLLRLGTDYLDLYQVHTPDRHTNIFGIRGVAGLDGDDGVSVEETLSALTEVVKSGKVRHIGISNETPWGISEYLRLSREKGLARIVSIQNQFSLLNRTFEIGMSEMCLRENIALLPYSVLNKGVLTGKYFGGARPAGARFTLWERDFPRYNPPHAQVPLKKYMDLAANAGIEPSQLAIAFALTRDFIPSVIIAGTSIAQLKTNIDSIDISLSEDVMQSIKSLSLEHPDPTC